MKTFKQFVNSVPSDRVLLTYRDGDDEAAIHALSLLEEGQTFDLGKGWKARFDRAHIPQQQDHVHLSIRGSEYAVINKDGTPSHGPNPRVPRKIQAELVRRGLISETSTAILETAGADLYPRLTGSAWLMILAASASSTQDGKANE
ncbi:hypothetical protein [Shinella sp.]|uniref:hypothetical protein n=1 Tax=Shinella sp. TaxID=1870904 RepID=UPI0028A765E0|nr:hypothetical protein [Shinella sp.]